MRSYLHHIGDFDRATRHLSRIERSVYRDLLDLYYDTESPLALDIPTLCRRIIARSNEESTAVEQVLNEFFNKTPEGWWHSRCEAEIDSYKKNNNQKAQAGKASAEARRLKKQRAMNGNSTAVEQPLNPVEHVLGIVEQPLTSVEHPLDFVSTDSNGDLTNHEPLTNIKKTEQKKGTDVQPVDPSLSSFFNNKIGDTVSDRAEEIVAVLKKNGFQGSVNSSDTRLLALIQRGAVAQDFKNAMEINSGKGFAYLLGIVKNKIENNGSDDCKKTGFSADIAKSNVPSAEETSQFLARRAAEAANCKSPGADTIKEIRGLKTSILQDEKNQLAASS